MHERILLALFPLALLPRSAHADDAPPAVAAPPPRSAHERTMDQLHDELAEIELRARIERARWKVEADRKARSEPPPPRGLGSARLRRGSLVLPEMLGVSASGFGGLGALSVSGPISFGTTRIEDGTGQTVVALSPSLDVFVSDHVTVGGRVQATRATSTQRTWDGPVDRLSTDESFGLGIAPRVGYVVRLTDDLLLWPQVGVSFGGGEGSAPHASAALGVTTEVGLVAPLGRHVLARVAPTASYTRVWSGSWGDADVIDAGFRAHLGLAF